MKFGQMGDMGFVARKTVRADRILAKLIVPPDFEHDHFEDDKRIELLMAKVGV